VQRDVAELLVGWLGSKVNGSGKSWAAAASFVLVRRGAGDGPGCGLCESARCRAGLLRGHGREESCRAWTAGGGVLAGYSGLSLWPAGWAPPGQAAGPEWVGSGPRARPNLVG
jgi:hypothetical protein